MRTIALSRILLPVISSLLVAAAAYANTPAAALIRPLDDGSIRIRFTAFNLPANTSHNFAVRSGDAVSESFSIPTSGFSTGVGVDDRQFELGLSIPVPSADGGPPMVAFTPLQQITLPAEGQAFLALLLPTADGKLQTTVIRADDPAFKTGDIQFFNLGAEPIAVRMDGDSRILVAPYSHTRTSPPQKEKAETYQVEFYVRQQDNTIQLFGATRWRATPRQRGFVFFFPDPQHNRYAWRSISEFPSWVSRHSDRLARSN